MVSKWWQRLFIFGWTHPDWPCQNSNTRSVQISSVISICLKTKTSASHHLQPDFPTVHAIKCCSQGFHQDFFSAFHPVCFVGHATQQLCYGDRVKRCSCISFSALITLMNQSDCGSQSDFISLRLRKPTDLKGEAHFSCKWRLLLSRTIEQKPNICSFISKIVNNSHKCPSEQDVCLHDTDFLSLVVSLEHLNIHECIINSA